MFTMIKRWSVHLFHLPVTWMHDIGGQIEKNGKKTQIWIYVLNINSKTKTFHKPIIAACDEFIFDLWIPACIVQHCNMSLWKVRVTYSVHVYEKEIIKYHQKGTHNKLVSPCLRPSKNFCAFSMIITCANFQWYESN